MAVLQFKSVLIWTLVSIQFQAPPCLLTLTVPPPTQQTYSIMIDVGSSKLNIYKFIVNDDVLEMSEVQQVKVSSNKLKPGIASFADNPSEIGSYMLYFLL